MATLGSDPRPHSQLASASIQSNISGNNVPTNRGLERALEEGANSGFFNLSARKLKEFPRTASNFDLSDTVEGDLSRNRLAEVPSEVCHLVALESLNLYHNCIKTIPDTIINLQSLTSLNLSRNQLCALPACLCGLPLRVLNASNNKLVCIPEAIGQLRSLMELDVSCNEITALPRHIGRLKALRELNVRRNLLCVLPEDLAELPLVKFDFSCNKVSTIPVSYRKMAQLQNLQLENNPLQSPPAQICMKGKVHIFKYLSIEACRSDKMPDSLYLPDIDQNKKQDTDSGVGSDNGDKRLSATESMESVDPQFTMRRKMEQLREELELMEQLRESIESRLKVALPEDLGSSLMDGVVLCHLANHIRPRSVASIHVPSSAVPKLSMAKCRRNVENFLDACRKMGVPEDKLCLPHHILEEKGMIKVSMTVQALVDETSTKQALFT
uniref:Leucine rich repeats and calponin homology domain containing 1 n=1 Tax=Salmo trutta TaxID=8032 RepID=A0A673XPP2_SALTR